MFLRELRSIHTRYSGIRYVKPLFSTLKRCETPRVRQPLAWILITLAMLVNGAAFAESTTPSVPLPAYQFPELIDDGISPMLQKSLYLSAADMPKPYKDRCHVQQNLTVSPARCLYGNLKSKTTIVLFGDSHALSWFPAIEKLAITKKWRLLSLTMSSCWPATIPAWNSVTNVLMTNCEIWRKGALKQIAQIKPYLTFVTGSRGFSTIDGAGNLLLGDARLTIWQSGMATTLNAIKKASTNTVLISDTPVSLFAPPDCLAAFNESIKLCSTPVANAIDTNWLGVERDLAITNNVIWINPTEWICDSDPCSPVAGDTVIYRDSGHLTASFALSLERPLWAELSNELTK